MMKKAKYTLYLLPTLFLVNISFAQDHVIDSLKNVLKTEQNDTNKVNTLNATSTLLWTIGKYDNSLICSSSALILAKKLEYKKGIVKALQNFGIIYSNQGDYTKSMEYDLKALAINEEIGDKDGVSINLTNIGVLYTYEGNYPKALEYDLKALAIDEETGDKKGIADELSNIGIIYDELGNFPKALEYYLKGLAIFKEINDEEGIANTTNTIGIIYKEQKNYSKALECYEQALEINKKIRNNDGIACNIGNIGNIYSSMNNDSKALEYQFKALALYEELGNKKGIAINMINIVDGYIKQKKFSIAKTFLDSALAISREMGTIDVIRDIYKSQYTIDSSLGKPSVAFDDYKKYITYRDSLINQEGVKRIAQMEISHLFEEKEDSVKAEQAKANIIKAAEIKRKNIITNGTIIISFLIIILAILLLRMQQIKSRKDKIIFEKENNLLKTEKQYIEDELASAKNILDDYIQSMSEKNKLLEQFKNDFEELKSLKSKELNEVRIEDLEHLNKATILTEEDWDKFKKLFEQVHKGFFTRLKDKLPDLTQAEIRLVCLTKLKIDTKQMAGILGVSADTIRKSRYRLRKKIGLSEENTLDDVSESI